MNCPACKSPMFAVEYDGLELDHCHDCLGTWFDAGELALLFADADDQPRPELVPSVLRELPTADSAERPRRCPQCRRSMRKVNIGLGAGVIIDVCGRGHGLFCDRGEVADLARGLAPDPDNLPARVMAYLGGALGRGDAASETE